MRFYLLLIFILIGIDQGTKILILQWGSPIMNYAFIGGSFENLAIEFRIFFVSSLSFYLFLSYFLILYFWKHLNHIKIKLALTFLITGILSNSLDKIFRGSVIDYIHIGSYVMNVADIFLLVGSIGILFYLFKDYSLIFYENSTRNSFLISYYQKESLKFILTFIFCFWITLSVFALLLLKTHSAYEQVIITLLLGLFAFLLLFTILFSLAYIMFSNRSSGPIKAFVRYVKDLRDGKDYDFQLRQNDFHQELENLAKEIRAIHKKE